MRWPIDTSPLRESELPIFQSYYLRACRVPCDPTMIWATEVDVTALHDYLRRLNRDSDVIVTGAHVLIKAVAAALGKHPELNRRVAGRRLFHFRGVHVLMPMLNAREHEMDVLLVKDADLRGLSEIARAVWQDQHEAARGQFRYASEKRLYRFFPQPLAGMLMRFQLWWNNRFAWPLPWSQERQGSSPVLVNYLTFRDAPPMLGFKPSRFPSDGCSLNVTMGPAQRRPVALGNEVAIRPMAPLFVRADHRMVDAHELGRFTETVRRHLSEPDALEASPPTDAALPKPHTRSAAPDQLARREHTAGRTTNDP